MAQVNFKHCLCNVEFHRYQDDGTVAIQLVDAEAGEPVIMATVCIPSLPESERQRFADEQGIRLDQVILIKTWSENRGICNALWQAGIAKPTSFAVPCGYAQAIVMILDESLLSELPPRQVDEEPLDPEGISF